MGISYRAQWRSGRLRPSSCILDQRKAGVRGYGDLKLFMAALWWGVVLAPCAAAQQSFSIEATLSGRVEPKCSLTTLGDTTIPINGAAGRIVQAEGACNSDNGAALWLRYRQLNPGERLRVVLGSRLLDLRGEAVALASIGSTGVSSVTLVVADAALRSPVELYLELAPF